MNLAAIISPSLSSRYAIAAAASVAEEAMTAPEPSQQVGDSVVVSEEAVAALAGESDTASPVKAAITLEDRLHTANVPEAVRIFSRQGGAYSFIASATASTEPVDPLLEQRRQAITDALLAPTRDIWNSWIGTILPPTYA